MKDILAIILGYWYRVKFKLLKRNIHVGEGLKVFKKLKIQGKGKIFIGKNCIIKGIRGDSNQYVTLYTHDKGAVINIGNNACLCAARISSKFAVTIGNDVLLEESGIMDTDFHSIERSRGLPPDEVKDKCEVIIGTRVSVGAKSIITKGVKIGDDVIIMPGSIVTKSVPSGCMVLGNPARIYKKLI